MPSRPRRLATWFIAARTIRCAVAKFLLDKSLAMPEPIVERKPTLALPKWAVDTSEIPIDSWPDRPTVGDIVELVAGPFKGEKAMGRWKQFTGAVLTDPDTMEPAPASALTAAALKSISPK